ncbi:hypothetical protein ACHAW6_011404 [Cyclotella cf. meneghiniana]
MVKTTLSFLLLSCSTRQYTSSAFLPPSPIKTNKLRAAASSSLGDLFSGITGLAPSSLEPPRGVLSGTSIDPTREDVDLGRVYKASVDGWSAIDFHKCVDGKGSALVVALTKSGKRFGGYNPLGWMSSDDYGNTNNAFLWFERNGRGVKCPVLAGGNAAVFDFATGGPTFGSADMCIGPPRAPVMGGFTGPDMENVSSVAGDLRRGKSSLGGAYSFQNGWPVAGEFGVVEVEVYCNLNVGKKLAYGNKSGFSIFGF